MNKRLLLSLILFLVAIPTAAVLGLTVLKNVRWLVWSLTVAALSVIPFLFTFERRRHSLTRLILIAAMVALSVGGRILFYAMPGFKPITAMVILTAVYFGPEAGYMTGSMAALLSNFYFGQGPWTPFQMAAWGLIGFFAGLLQKRLRKSLPLLAVYGAAVGVLYSLILNFEHTVGVMGAFVPAEYAAVTVASLGFTAIYAVSNVVFLLVLKKPVGKILERVTVKYGLGKTEETET